MKIEKITKDIQYKINDYMIDKAYSQNWMNNRRFKISWLTKDLKIGFALQKNGELTLTFQCPQLYVKAVNGNSVLYHTTEDRHNIQSIVDIKQFKRNAHAIERIFSFDPSAILDDDYYPVYVTKHKYIENSDVANYFLTDEVFQLITSVFKPIEDKLAWLRNQSDTIKSKFKPIIEAVNKSRFALTLPIVIDDDRFLRLDIRNFRIEGYGLNYDTFPSIVEGVHMTINDLFRNVSHIYSKEVNDGLELFDWDTSQYFVPNTEAGIDAPFFLKTIVFPLDAVEPNPGFNIVSSDFDKLDDRSDVQLDDSKFSEFTVL